MAVMQNCCCCGVRQGSVASAIYTLIIAILGLGYFGWEAAVVETVNIEFETTFAEVLGDYDFKSLLDAFFAVYIIAVIVFVFKIIACIFVFVGISQDSKGMLIPFMVAQGLHLLWYVVYFIVCAYFLASFGLENDEYGFAYLAAVILIIPFCSGDIVCLLCVISQYQEYRDGRGRLSDSTLTQRQTTVIVQQQPQQPEASGAFGYVQMQEPPPAYVGHKMVPNL